MRRALIATLLGAAACALREVPGPPGEEQVVVQGVLSTHATQQVLWIERTIPAGDEVTGNLRPLLVPPSHVEVRDSTGLVIAFQADPSNAARFVAAFTPTPGWRYDLVVDLGTHVLSARTRVPEVVTILDPAADTVTVPRDSFPITWSGPIRTIRVAYADTADRYTGYAPASWIVDDTVTQLSWIPYFPPSTSAIQVWVLAVDSVTARLREPFFGPFGDSFNRRDGNITGGAGFFGAATADSFVVRFQ